MEAKLDKVTKNIGTASQKDIFRLSASLYTEMTDGFSTQSVLLHVVKCVFSKTENSPTTTEEILSNVSEFYSINISEDELISILSRNKKMFVKSKVDSICYYCLEETEYGRVLDDLQDSIDSYITLYINENKITDESGCQDAIYKYLYELTTTNINSYRLLLTSLEKGETFTESDLSVDSNTLTDSERQYVHDFVEWDNKDKNIALSNIVLCCLEYCLCVSGDKDNSLVSKYIKDKTIFFDTNIIFRALEINGKARQRVVLSFLNKCCQAKIKMIITSYTKKEFFETVDYYISQIRQYPRGEIYLGAYESISDYNIYAFYNEWLQDHESLSLKYFRIFIQSAYDSFVSEYKIETKDKIEINIFTTEATKIRDTYAKSILARKREIKDKYINIDEVPYQQTSQQFSHDATLVYIVENSPSTQNGAQNFIVSSDKALRYWDMTRESHQNPVVIYPSQLFLMLIRVCGRSENDLDSFVSFINIRGKTHQLSPEKANVVLSGISSITEDISTQKILVSSVFDDEFQSVIKNSNTDKELYENTQLFSQRYLDEELNSSEAARLESVRKLREKEDQVVELNKTTIKAEVEIIKIKEESEKSLRKKSQELEAQKEKICNFAERKIRFRYVATWYVIPIFIIMLTVIFVAFVALQFICCNATWNVVTKFLNFIKNTTFCSQVTDYVYAIDVAIAALLGGAYKYLMKNPLNVKKRKDSKIYMVQNYISNKNL